MTQARQVGKTEPKHGAIGQHWQHKILGTLIVVLAREEDTRIGWPQRQIAVWSIASFSDTGGHIRRRKIRDDNLVKDYVLMREAP